MDIYILRNGEETGPYSEDAAQGLLAQGEAAATDLSWRPGMPEWIPLKTLLSPGSEAEEAASEAEPEMQMASDLLESAQPTRPIAILDPVPAVTPAPAASAPATPMEVAAAPASGAARGDAATAKQKALLAYLGITVPPDATKEQAALLVNDAMENPKDPARLARWNEDRLRLHPELFAAELQAKKEGRAQHYFELTQTEGAECFDGVTKAHCQVLVGFLDISHPSWDANEREAAWNYFFPAIAEKFPDVVRKEWRGKLSYPKGPKIARAMKRTPPAVAASAVRAKPVQRASPVAALMKGLVYGALLLGIAAGGYYLWQHPEIVIAWRKKLNAATAATASARPSKPAQPPEVATGNAPGRAIVAPSASNSTDSLFGPPPTTPATAPAPSGEAPAMNGAPVASAGDAMPSTPANGMAAAGSMGTPAGADAPLFDPGVGSSPAPAASGDMGSLFAPSTPPAAPVAPPKTRVSLTKPIDVQTTYGKVTVPAGTVLKLVGYEGTSVRVNYANSTILVPVASTDLGDSTAPPSPGQ